MKSIIQEEKECLICGQTYRLEKHHVMNGWAQRKKADQDGLVVWLCMNHHRQIHADAEKRKILKAYAQKCWCDYYNKNDEDFIKRYGKNYR